MGQTRSKNDIILSCVIFNSICMTDVSRHMSEAFNINKGIKGRVEIKDKKNRISNTKVFTELKKCVVSEIEENESEIKELLREKGYGLKFDCSHITMDVIKDIFDVTRSKEVIIIDINE